MRFSDLANAVKHLMRTTACSHCKGKHTEHDVNVILTTKLEGLFELRCGKCHISSLMTVILSPTIETKKNSLPPPGRVDIQNITSNPLSTISKNDILDVKNFLNNFDGNFKKLFTNEK